MNKFKVNLHCLNCNQQSVIDIYEIRRIKCEGCGSKQGVITEIMKVGKEKSS